MANEWLRDKDFFASCDFNNKYYLEELCRHLDVFIKSLPFNMVLYYNGDYITYFVGSEKLDVPIDENISYWDYTTLLRKQLKRYFPQYLVSVDMLRGITEEEILVKMKEEGLKYEQASSIKIPVTKTEYGMITSIALKEDEFTFERDGVKEIRKSGNVNKPLLLREFLKKLRDIIFNIKSDNEIRAFILANSVVKKTIGTIGMEPRNITISYPPKMMKNFFIINMDELVKHDFFRMETLTYSCGNYEICFDNAAIENDCITLYKEAKGHVI